MYFSCLEIRFELKMIDVYLNIRVFVIKKHSLISQQKEGF